MAALVFDIWMDICDHLDLEALVNLYNAFDNIDAITAAVRKRTQGFLSTLITTAERYTDSYLSICLTDDKYGDREIFANCEECS